TGAAPGGEGAVRFAVELDRTAVRRDDEGYPAEEIPRRFRQISSPDVGVECRSMLVGHLSLSSHRAGEPVRHWGSSPGRHSTTERSPRCEGGLAICVPTGSGSCGRSVLSPRRAARQRRGVRGCLRPVPLRRRPAPGAAYPPRGPVAGDSRAALPLVWIVPQVTVAS